MLSSLWWVSESAAAAASSVMAGLSSGLMGMPCGAYFICETKALQMGEKCEGDCQKSVDC